MPHSGRSCCYHRKKDLIIEMRQCMCNNTMAVMVEDSRDYSIKGVVKRVLFKKLVSRSMELLQSRNEMAFLNQLKTVMRRI